MYSQGILRTDSIESTSKKTNRALYILGFIEFIFVFICLLLLLLNQNLNKIVDDYSPAYQIPDDDDNYYTEQDWTTLSTTNSPHTTSEQDSTTLSTTNSPLTTSEQDSTTLSTTNSPLTTSEENTSVSDPVTSVTKALSAAYSEVHPTLKMIFPTKNPTMHHTTRGNDTAGFFNNRSKTYNDSDLDSDENTTAGRHKKANETMIESATESPLDHPKTAMNLKPEEEGEWIEVFISNLIPGSALFRLKRKENIRKENQAQGSTQSNLRHLLIMYPCCVSAMILLWMQLISRLMNDNMFKSTMIAFISICIALGTTIFAVSVLESVYQKNSIAILIAVSSAIFIILEVIDFILLFVAM